MFILREKDSDKIMRRLRILFPQADIEARFPSREIISMLSSLLDIIADLSTFSTPKRLSILTHQIIAHGGEDKWKLQLEIIPESGDIKTTLKYGVDVLPLLNLGLDSPRDITEIITLLDPYLSSEAHRQIMKITGKLAQQLSTFYPNYHLTIESPALEVYVSPVFKLARSKIEDLLDLLILISHKYDKKQLEFPDIFHKILELLYKVGLRRGIATLTRADRIWRANCEIWYPEAGMYVKIANLFREMPRISILAENRERLGHPYEVQMLESTSVRVNNVAIPISLYVEEGFIPTEQQRKIIKNILKLGKY